MPVQEHLTRLRAEAVAEEERLQEVDRQEGIAAEDTWLEMEREREYEAQQTKFKRLKEAQQRRKAAKVADWAIWAEQEDARREDETRKEREKMAADWAEWTNSEIRRKDRQLAISRAKAFKDWENWELLNTPADRPGGGAMESKRTVRVEAVGNHQPVKKARWTFPLTTGRLEKIGFHFTIQKITDGHS